MLSTMSSPPQPRQPFSPRDHTRLSDHDRDTAIDLLSQAVRTGQLTLTDFDTRCTQVWGATVRGELAEVFEDLDVAAQSREHVYTESEIEAARRSGTRPRAGVFWGGTLLACGGSVFISSAAAPLLPLFVAAGLFILLYVARVGPASWYAPSPRSIDRERQRQLKQAYRLRALERREERAAAAHEWGSIVNQSAQNMVRRRRSPWHDGAHE